MKAGRCNRKGNIYYELGRSHQLQNLTIFLGFRVFGYFGGYFRYFGVLLASNLFPSDVLMHVHSQMCLMQGYYYRANRRLNKEYFQNYDECFRPRSEGNQCVSKNLLQMSAFLLLYFSIPSKSACFHLYNCIISTIGERNFALTLGSKDRGFRWKSVLFCLSAKLLSAENCRIILSHSCHVQQGLDYRKDCLKEFIASQNGILVGYTPAPTDPSAIQSR